MPRNDKKKDKSNEKEKTPSPEPGTATEEQSDHESVGDPPTEYVVKKILREEVDPDGSIHYLVRWDGFGSDDDTWEPEDSLRHLEAWEKYTLKKKKKEKSGKRGRPRKKKKDVVEDLVSEDEPSENPEDSLLNVSIPLASEMDAEESPSPPHILSHPDLIKRIMEKDSKDIDGSGDEMIEMDEIEGEGQGEGDDEEGNDETLVEIVSYLDESRVDTTESKKGKSTSITSINGEMSDNETMPLEEDSRLNSVDIDKQSSETPDSVAIVMDEKQQKTKKKKQKKGSSSPSRAKTTIEIVDVSSTDMEEEMDESKQSSLASGHFSVESIRGHKYQIPETGKVPLKKDIPILYRVKWVGHDETTWEGADNVQGCRKLVKDYRHSIEFKQTDKKWAKKIRQTRKERAKRKTKKVKEVPDSENEKGSSPQTDDNELASSESPYQPPGSSSSTVTATASPEKKRRGRPAKRGVQETKMEMENDPADRKSGSPPSKRRRKNGWTIEHEEGIREQFKNWFETSKRKRMSKKQVFAEIEKLIYDDSDKK